MNMRFTPTQIRSGNIGDSKFFLYRKEEGNDYVLIILDKDSAEVEIIDRQKDDNVYVSLNGSEMPEHVIVESIKEEQLAELGSFLAERFPKKEKIREHTI